VAKEEKVKRGKGKAKDTVGGEGKESGPAPPKQREQQPEAGPSRIRATSPLPKKKAKAVPQPSGAEATVPSGATGARHSRAKVTVPQPKSRPSPWVTMPPMTVWKSRFHAGVPPPKTSKAPRTHGVPTDEMARLSVHEGQEGVREGASHSHRRLGSLEGMDVDGEDGPQGSKWKRGDERERDHSDGEEEKEDDEADEEVEERKAKRPRAGASKRRIEGTGKYYNPPCQLCQQIGKKCEKQKKTWACCWCAVKKMGCKRGKGDKRRNARDSGPEDDSDDEPALSGAEGTARQPVAVPSKGLDRKGKAKGKFLLSYYIPR